MTGGAMSGAPVLVVVGPPGSGKSTIGKLLARKLDVAFADTDALIEKRIGRTIADMFTTDGEDAFRALEREVIAESLEAGHGVLALGGGAVLADATRALLREHRVVALDVDLTDGMRRTGMSTARPLLAGVNPRATFRSLLAARAPLYREVATVRVDTSRRSPNQVVALVLTELGETPAQAAPAAPDAQDPHDRPTPRESAPLPSPGFGEPRVTDGPLAGEDAR